MFQTGYGRSSDGAPTAQKPRNVLLLRIAYTLGFAVLGWALLWFSFALAVLQLIVTAVAGRKNLQLAEFGSRIGSWMREILRFLTGASDTMPFPLASFPSA